jgi:hypothetical protein
MDQPFDMARLLELRRLTRRVDDVVRVEAREHLATLAPLLRPQTVLGDFVQGGEKQSVRGADRVWKELVTLYDGIAGKSPFGLARELKPPLHIPGTTLEMAPVQYVHEARAGAHPTPVVVTRPFEWVVSYSAHGPQRARDLLADRNRDAEELQRLIALALALNLAVARQAGVAKLFATLRLPLQARRVGEFGDLPLTVMVSVVPSLRPPDDVLVQSTEMTGERVFQEVVDPAGIERLEDPLRARLLSALRGDGEGAPST